MFKELIYNLLWKGLEILGVCVIGYWLFILIESTFATLWAILAISIIFWFFTPIIKPYLDAIRKWLFVKITGIDKEEFKKDEKNI